LRIYPTNEQVENHNNCVLKYYQKQGIKMHTIIAQDEIINSTRKLNKSLEAVTPKDINKTGALPKKLIIFEGAKVMLRANINVSKGLVNGAIGTITEIKWPYFRKGQICDTDIPSIMLDLGRDGIHQISPISV